MTKSPARKKAYKRGLWAETLCAWFLRLKGYRILAQRFRTPVGEIDLVAKRRGIIVFVEVKARPETRQAVEAVSMRQQQRIARASESFIQRHPGYETFLRRFDVMAFTGTLTIIHIRDAWRV